LKDTFEVPGLVRSPMESEVGTHDGQGMDGEIVGQKVIPMRLRVYRISRSDERAVVPAKGDIRDDELVEKSPSEGPDFQLAREAFVEGRLDLLTEAIATNLGARKGEEKNCYPQK